MPQAKRTEIRLHRSSTKSAVLLSGVFRALCTGVALATWVAPEALAVTDAPAVLTADIPAQPLAQALDAFAQQTGLHLVYVSELVRNRKSYAVGVGLSADKALARLLQGTGLSFEFLTAHSVRILAADLPSPKSRSDSNATPEARSEGLKEVVVTGTRQLGLKAADSAAPIQLLSAETLARAAGQPDLVRTLAALVPSLSAQSFGFDTSNATLQARLRGLSPNHVLILIDGKRRHPTANLAVAPGAFQGGASADLNFIPIAAIDHVEVLTEGAAAQYGSDAIAGVVNIILKKNSVAVR
jgi:outer membrane receptor protein involved in Fe transport